MESERQLKRRNIIIAFIMSAQVVITLLFLMFALTYKVEAEKWKETAHKQSLVASAMLEQAKVVNMRAQKMNDSLTIELEKLKTRKK